MRRWAVTMLALAGLLACRSPLASNPNALWQIVHGQCVPHAQAGGDPAPCARVDLTAGYAVLKDNSPEKPDAYLLIPTERLTGIGSKALLQPDAPDYWQDAWQARDLVAAQLGRPLPRDWVGMAINSRYGRTQDQLHIHVSCLRADVRAALARHQAAIGARWAAFPDPLAGERYEAMRIDGADLRAVAPFRLLADGIPGAREAMDGETLAVAGIVFDGGRPGFVLLADRADPARGNSGVAEELLGQTCRLGR